MITAEQIRKMAHLDNSILTDLLDSKFTEQVLNSEFVGVTNGGQFCYDVTSKTKWGIQHTKVFVWQEDDGRVVAHSF